MVESLNVVYSDLTHVLNIEQSRQCPDGTTTILNYLTYVPNMPKEVAMAESPITA